jgi:hypothetical protein
LFLAAVAFALAELFPEALAPGLLFALLPDGAFTEGFTDAVFAGMGAPAAGLAPDGWALSGEPAVG